MRKDEARNIIDIPGLLIACGDGGGLNEMRLGGRERGTSSSPEIESKQKIDKNRDKTKKEQTCCRNCFVVGLHLCAVVWNEINKNMRRDKKQDTNLLSEVLQCCLAPLCCRLE